MNFFKHRPLAICCAVFLSAYFICFYLPSCVKIVTCILSVLIAAFFIKRKGIIAAICISVLLGNLLGYLYYDVHAVRSAQNIDNEQYVEFEVTDITFQNESIAYIDGKTSEGHKYHFTVYSPDDLRIGDVLSGNCTFRAITESDDFDAERYYNSKDIWIEAEVSSPEKIDHNTNVFRDVVESVRSFCIERFDRYTDEDASALLSALAIGDKSGLDDSLRRDFTRAGVSHMLAISGMHLSVIIGCISMFADIFSLSRRTSAVIVSMLCLSFIFISGASSSVLRAGLMFIIMSCGDLFRRRSDSLTNLFTAVTLIVIFSPSAIFDIGLILSFTASHGIIVIVGYYMRKMNKTKESNLFKKLLSCIIISVLTTFAAQAFSFIALLIFFDSTSMISVLSNLILSPIMTLVLFCIPLLLCVSFVPFAAAGVGFVMSIATDLIIWLVSLFSALPNASVSLNHPFVIYTFIAAVIGVFPVVVIRSRIAYILPYLCWFLTFTLALVGYNLSYGNSADFLFYSESASDALFVRNREGTVYLDIGRGSDAAEDRAFDMIEDHLYSDELEFWVLTHYSNDSVYAAADYMDTFYIRNICIPEPVDDLGVAAATELEYYANKENVNLIYYEYGSQFELNGIEFTVYTPITFEDSSVFIPSADIGCGDDGITYYGLGYFDYGEFDCQYDYLYIGECGTKRKQKASPEIKATNVIIAENNDVAGANISGERTKFTQDRNYAKIRIG